MPKRNDPIPLEGPRGKIRRLSHGSWQASNDPDSVERGQSASRSSDFANSRQQHLLKQLQSLPKDIREEYLGPQFNSETVDLRPYEEATGLEYYSRAYLGRGDVPDILVQIHPDLFLEINRFKAFADCASAKSDNAFPANLWQRNILVESPPYKSDSVYRALCKRQLEELHKELDQCSLIDWAARRSITEKFDRAKLVDSRKYNSLTLAQHLSPKNEQTKLHQEYILSKIDISKKKIERLLRYGADRANARALPKILSRRTANTFISGELMQEACQLLQATPTELHDENDIQLMQLHCSAGEYQSLFKHLEERFKFPNALQTSQLSLPTNFRYRKEKYFGDQYDDDLKTFLTIKQIEEVQEFNRRDDGNYYCKIKSENDGETISIISKRKFVREEMRAYKLNFIKSMHSPARENTPGEQDNGFLYLRISFVTLLQSRYHKVRMAISLLEDEAPFTLDRCQEIKRLLNLDDRLRYIGPTNGRERERGRDMGR